MEKQSRQGPFRPGPGGLPPYLAGRESEQELCLSLLADLQDGLAPPREIVLHGPRGNGKTALLVWLQREAAKCPGVDVLRLTPASIPSETKLVERVLPASLPQRLAPDEISLHGITWRPGQGHLPPLDEALAARARKKPLILMLDEAHTLDGRVGCALLNASQQAGRELPFLLVLAGTPSLRSHLNSMNASFWNRAERRPIGRLDMPATEAAIRRPMEGEDIAIDGEALGHVVRASHGYPYFVQVWGQALWRRVVGAASPGTERRLTCAVAAAAQADFDREKNSYHLDRYEELEKSNLLPVARAVADSFELQPVLDDARLETAVRRGLGASEGCDGMMTAKDAMRDLGYVWRSGVVPAWEPGIPSFIDYVREHTPPYPRVNSDTGAWPIHCASA